MEELDFKGLIDRFNAAGLLRGEQVILGHFGTVQTLLSLIFGEPVNVQLQSQREKEGDVTRQVHLMAGKTMAAEAASHIPRSRNREDVMDAIAAGKLGLGQIVVVSQIPTKRSLVEVGRDREGFWRTYAIEGPELYIKIYEYFPRKPYQELGWLEVVGG